MKDGHEFFSHTADVGLRAAGGTLTELFVHMAQGLVELIAEDSRLESRTTRTISLTAADTESLLVAWLSELLFWFSTDRFLPVAYPALQIAGTKVTATVRGDRFDPARHVQGREVKAITRHAANVTQRQSEWLAEVIVDI